MVLDARQRTACQPNGNVDISGGLIDGVNLGSRVPVTITNATFSALTLTGATISASTISSTTIGATTPSTGAFTTLTGSILSVSTSISGNTIAAATTITAGTLVTGTAISASTIATMAGATVDTVSNTVTLTNKRITARSSTTNAPGATPTINTDNLDFVELTGLSAAITSMTTNLTGTPNRGDALIITFTDNGTPAALTFGAKFEASSVALPTTTVASTKLTVGFIWNTVTSAWRITGSS